MTTKYHPPFIRIDFFSLKSAIFIHCRSSAPPQDMCSIVSIGSASLH